MNQIDYHKQAIKHEEMDGRSHIQHSLCKAKEHGYVVLQISMLMDS